MEDIDGGLHPAVDGQTLDERRKKDCGFIILSDTTCFAGYIVIMARLAVVTDNVDGFMNRVIPYRNTASLA